MSTRSLVIVKLNAGVYQILSDSTVLGYITRWHGIWYVAYDLLAQERIVRKNTLREAKQAAEEHFA